MFNELTNWLERQHQKHLEIEYREGQIWAATHILVDENIERIEDITFGCDDPYHSGARDMKRKIYALQESARKREAAEKENLALRQIVRKMQQELTDVLTELSESCLAKPQAPLAEPLESEPDVPEWANWTAADENGSVWAYEDEPVNVGHAWDVHKGNFKKVKLEPHAVKWQHSKRRIDRSVNSD